MLKDEYANAYSRAFKRTAYGRWLQSEGVLVHEDWAVSDVWQLEQAPWPRMGVNACFITMYPLMEGRRGMFVADIPPGKATEPIHHLYEQTILVLDGHGTTEVWQQGDTRKHVFEWGPGAIFSPPLNTWYRMYNISSEAVKFIAINRAPSIMNELAEPEFLFECLYSFRNRFNGEENYFGVAERTQHGERAVWETNFLPNAFGADLDPADHKVAAGTLTSFHMAGNLMAGHISEWPVGRYHKAHYHAAGAIIFGLASSGYVLIWPKDAGKEPYSNGYGDQVVEVPWGRGSVYAPPSEWYHQHFNTGAEPARHFAIHGGNTYSAAPLGQAAEATNPSMRESDEGGTMLAYEEEDPEVRRRFREALRASGVESQMGEELFTAGFAAARRATAVSVR
ncbi:MAG: hypothetical protein HW416_1389 [Chloroflexi bacterium]|nr:hypothetical protein [Chloroflexota bacterium]